VKFAIIAKGSGLIETPTKWPKDWLAITVSGTHEKYPYSDIIVDMHEYDIVMENHPEVIIDVNKRKIPYYTIREHDNVPSSKRYPIEEIIKEFGSDYFTNSIAYAIALAIYFEAEEIKLYGASLAWESEYYYERPCVEYWIAYARGRGVKVTVGDPRHTTLLRCIGEYDQDKIANSIMKLYGYNVPQNIVGCQEAEQDFG